ncbi:unnamed protein product [Ascophyllum nodosum]
MFYSGVKPFSLTTRQHMEVQLFFSAANLTSSAMFRSRVTTPMLVEELSTPMITPVFLSEARPFSPSIRQYMEVPYVFKTKRSSTAPALHRSYPTRRHIKEELLKPMATAMFYSGVKPFSLTTLQHMEVQSLWATAKATFSAIFRLRVTMPLLMEEPLTPLRTAMFYSGVKPFSLTTRQHMEVQLVFSAANLTSSAMFRSRATTPMLVQELSTPVSTPVFLSEARPFSPSIRQHMEVQYTRVTTASSTSLKEEASLFLTTMLTTLQANTINHVRVHDFLPSIVALDLRVIHKIFLGMFFTGALRLKNQTVFNSYGTASFVSNEAIFGGAIALYDGSTIHVDGMTSFDGNEATDNGGAVYSIDSSVFVETGTRFMSNVASNGSGGGVYASNSVVALIGAEFTKNHGASGGGWLSLVSRNVEC